MYSIRNVLLLRPWQRIADALRAIIAADHARFAAPPDDSFQGTDHPRRFDLGPQPLAIEVIDHIEQPEVATIAGRVVHEAIDVALHRRHGPAPRSRQAVPGRTSQSAIRVFSSLAWA